MQWQQLDFIFPFFVFTYGVCLTLILESKILDKIASRKMPAYHQTMISHKALAWVCFYVGGLWSLQNLIF
jgi:hypothetical protein